MRFGKHLREGLHEHERQIMAKRKDRAWTNWEFRAAVCKHYDTSLYCAACFSACSLQIFINLAALSICVSTLAHNIVSACCSSGSYTAT